MEEGTGNIDIVELKKLLASKVDLGVKIQEFTKSEGFLILKAFLKNFENDIKETRQPTWEVYNAKMEALEIIKGLFAEFDSYINNAEQAHDQIQQLIDSEGSTPSLLSLEGEGTEEGQQSEL